MWNTRRVEIVVRGSSCGLPIEQRPVVRVVLLPCARPLLHTRPQPEHLPLCNTCVYSYPDALTTVIAVVLGGGRWVTRILGGGFVVLGGLVVVVVDVVVVVVVVVVVDVVGST